MQDRYAGDIGDFFKLALIRSLAEGRRLGVAWYLVDDEAHNADGKHIAYLQRPERWRHLDPDLFDKLGKITQETRSVSAIQALGIIQGAFSHERLITDKIAWRLRSEWRRDWFNRVVTDLRDADLIFADPDNGLVDDGTRRRTRKVFRKQMPLSELKHLASDGRPVVVYHHNTRYKGGHELEIDHWIEQLGTTTLAVRCNAYSARTFFVLNADPQIAGKVRTFCDRWSGHNVKLHGSR